MTGFTAACLHRAWRMVLLVGTLLAAAGLGPGISIARAAVGDQLAKLTFHYVNPWAYEWDSFGTSVAISGNTALVGAWCDNDDGECSGSACLFSTVPEPGTLALLLTGLAASPCCGDVGDRPLVVGHLVLCQSTVLGWLGSSRRRAPSNVAITKRLWGLRFAPTPATRS